MSSENLDLQNKILQLLKNKYEEWFAQEDRKYPVWGYTLVELDRTIDLPRSDIIDRLNYMLNIQGIERVGFKRQHLYHYPKSGISDLDQYLSIHLQSKLDKQRQKEDDLSIKATLINCTTKEEINSITSELSEGQLTRIGRLMTYDESNRLNLIVNPPRFKVEEEVILMNPSDHPIPQENVKVLRVHWNASLMHHQYYLDSFSYRADNSTFYLQSQIKTK